MKNTLSTIAKQKDSTKGKFYFNDKGTLSKEAGFRNITFDADNTKDI